MPQINVKGREYATIAVKDSHTRRAQQYRNSIIDKFKKAGLSEDDFDVSEENIAFKKTPAYISWYIDGRHLYYSYSQGNNYAENLYVVSKVIETELAALIAEEQTINDLIDKFAEEHDIAEARKHARETLGLTHDVMDMDVINRAYKELAKEHHPDKSTGNTESFKKINNAHKLLKRELT